MGSRDSTDGVVRATQDEKSSRRGTNSRSEFLAVTVGACVNAFVFGAEPASRHAPIVLGFNRNLVKVAFMRAALASGATMFAEVRCPAGNLGGTRTVVSA